MAVEVRKFTVTTPAGTLRTAPLVTALTFPVRKVTELRARVPSGPAGALGFQFWVKGGIAVPYDPSQWIITDNETLSFPLDNFPTSGTWSMVSYNTGSYPHTVYVDFLVDVPDPGYAGAQSTFVPMDNLLLSNLNP